MNCDASKKYMMKYFDGERSAAEEEQFRRHLDDCPSCGREFGCMEAIFGDIGTSGDIEPPADFEAKIMGRISEIERERRERSAKRIVWLYNAATLLSIILLLVYVADMKQGGISGVFEKIREYFGSFSDAAAAVTGVAGDIAGLLGGAFIVASDVAVSLAKSYYYVFVALLTIIFIVQRLIHYIGTYGGSGRRTG